MLLLRARRRAERRARVLGLSEPLAQAELANEMRGAVVATKRVAREARVRRLLRELESLDVGATVGIAPSTGVIDTLYAARSTARFALDPTEHGLRRIAITENAKAYGETPVVVVPEGVRLFRRWDAMLDACPVCWALDGQIVPLGQSFAAGEPGDMHPHCRCTWSLVSVEEIERIAA